MGYRIWTYEIKFEILDFAAKLNPNILELDLFILFSLKIKLNRQRLINP
jgi:hypothetical protein